MLVLSFIKILKTNSTRHANPSQHHHDRKIDKLLLIEWIRIALHYISLEIQLTELYNGECTGGKES